MEFERGAEKALGKLDAPVRSKVISALRRLSEELTHHGRPVLSNVLKLNGAADRFRFRADDWRVVFMLEGDRLVVLVLDVGHRSDIYR